MPPAEVPTALRESHLSTDSSSASLGADAVCEQRALRRAVPGSMTEQPSAQHRAMCWMRAPRSANAHAMRRVTSAHSSARADAHVADLTSPRRCYQIAASLEAARSDQSSALAQQPHSTASSPSTPRMRGKGRCQRGDRDLKLAGSLGRSVRGGPESGRAVRQVSTQLHIAAAQGDGGLDLQRGGAMRRRRAASLGRNRRAARRPAGASIHVSAASAQMKAQHVDRRQSRISHRKRIARDGECDLS